MKSLILICSLVSSLALATDYSCQASGNSSVVTFTIQENWLSQYTVSSEPVLTEDPFVLSTTGSELVFTDQYGYLLGDTMAGVAYGTIQLSFDLSSGNGLLTTEYHANHDPNANPAGDSKTAVQLVNCKSL